MKGTVKFFNESKGFGFITGEDGKEYFFHISALSPGTSVMKGDSITFEVEQGEKGPKATQVAKA